MCLEPLFESSVMKLLWGFFVCASLNGPGKESSEMFWVFLLLVVTFVFSFK